MDWNYLRTFHAVSEAGSLAKAAEKLAISHATAFRHIRSLEEQLGSRLFEKVKGRYRATEAGAEILDLAQSVVVAMEDIDRRISGADLALKGRIRLTAPASFAVHFLPGYLLDFKARFPDITVELLTSNEEINMSSRAAEIALRVTSSPPEHLIGRKVADIPWAYFASQSYLDRKSIPASAGDLSSHDLIGASGLLAQRPGFIQMDRSLRDRIVVRSDDLTTMAALARKGLGLCLLPMDVAQDGLKKLAIATEVPANELWVLTHPDLRSVERVACMARFLATAFRTETAFSSE
ncbi:Transcriptional regulator [Stappia aggregata IAM 12614]|uniref:Transcriptional regulator n=1 Tax=Roseibium aggregatum (strain ATCC 25650 / DSM 13394 / JCM 20685 / NBRC 16684 / NCIMB 2208 / IAM 12614 / B1) TaxID=384765 RepID=A0NLN0_ROSAI|nr:LysR family transcriptional regulator [Roseibium aggregatum]EAV45975.1 Transcriptional regulator [Stappia aggregata IAM 12614] [Roseibium aggregatum IAM 12614]